MLPGMANMNHRRSLRVLVLAALMLAWVAGPPATAGKKGKKKMLARPVPIDSVPSVPMTLSRANDEWAEARAQTRIPLPFKKGRDKQGWSKSDWMMAQGERHKMRIWVNDRNDLREIIPQDSLLVGTNLIGERWFVQNPKKGVGVTVDFRFANYNGILRFEFNAAVDELDEVERFLRFNVLGISRRGDRIDAPASAMQPSRQPVATREAASRPPLPVPDLSVYVVSAEVRPAVVAPGDEIELVISYEVNDVARGRYPVVERRTLLRDGVEITFFEDTIERDDGQFTSTQKIRIPVDARTGKYSFRARVGVDDLNDEGDATFEVR